MISIIIVNYHVKKELFACIKSIIESRPKTAFEIIVVDNDELKTLEKNLKEKFPKIRYVPNDNKGFGQGNNVGSKIAKGEYLFFLNPDTKVYKETLDELLAYLSTNKKVGIVAPLLHDKNKKLYPQGANELTPLSAIFGFSFIHKLFPNNAIKRKYWYADEWSKKQPKEVRSIPGTAFVIRKKIFEKIKGFDEKFFLYFEEHDLCKRVGELGWKIVMLPSSKVFHSLGASTKQSPKVSGIFKQSRFYYLKKHYGLLQALVAESILRFSKYSLFISIVILAHALLISYRVSELMSFIGDQGWFYLSAKDMITTGTIPLVGIASSHPWLHQGASWTYMLAGMFWLFDFDPVSGAYLSIVFSIATVWMLYKISSYIFSPRVGIIAALLYASSPLIITNARMPYHTTPIPFFTLLFFFALYKWTTGDIRYFPVLIVLLAILYGLQIATFLLTVVFALVLLYGFFKKSHWFTGIFNPKTIVLSIAGFVLVMLPMLIYDLGHGFPQTLKFIAWLGYKVLVLFGYPPLNPDIIPTDYKTVISFLGSSYQSLVFIQNSVIAFTLAFFSFGYLCTKLDRKQSNSYNPAYILLVIICIVSIIGITVTRTTSDAYLPILFPIIPIVVALLFDHLLNTRKVLTLIILGCIVVLNVQGLIQKKVYSSGSYTLASRNEVMKQVVSEANGRSYTIEGRGLGSQFESFTMNYQYLAWYLGNEPSKNKQNLHFIINETPNGITVIKSE